MREEGEEGRGETARNIFFRDSATAAAEVPKTIISRGRWPVA